jgi:hypothetical protein
METIAAMAVVIIVGAVATPIASEIFSEYRFTSVTEEVAFEISRARMQAVGQNHFVRFRYSDGAFIRELSDDGVDYVADGASIPLPDGFVAEVGENGPPTFNRSGLAPTSTDIVLRGDGLEKTIHFNVLGRVTIS